MKTESEKGCGNSVSVTSACGLMHLISIMSDPNLNLCQL